MAGNEGAQAARQAAGSALARSRFGLRNCRDFQHVENILKQYIMKGAEDPSLFSIQKQMW